MSERFIDPEFDRAIRAIEASEPTAESLLREALEFLNDHPAFSLRRDPHYTSYKLAAKIDAYFRRRS